MLEGRRPETSAQAHSLPTLLTAKSFMNRNDDLLGEFLEK